VKGPTAKSRAAKSAGIAGRAGRIFASAAFERIGALALLMVLCLVRIWDPLPVQLVRVKSFDLYQNLKPSTVTERPVVIVDIDEDSLAKYGQWPWPRTLLARLVDRIAEYQAAAVAFDIVFAEPDRNSPASYAASMPELPATVRETLETLPSNDARFALALRRTNAVLALALLRGAREGETFDVPSPPIAVRGPPGTQVLSHLVGARSGLKNVDILHKSAKGAGVITHNPEFDGVVRRIPAIFRIDDMVHTALAIELIRVATGNRTLVVRAGPDGIENIVFAGVGGPSITVPTDRRGRLWVHFSPHDPKRYVSARHLLDGTLPRDRLAGRLVLVGTSAVGLLDIRATPLTGGMPGVEVHAQLIENILFQDHISRPFYADAVEFFAAVFLSLILILILPRFGAGRTLVSGLAGAGVIVGGAWMMFAQHGLLLDVTFPLACSFVVFAALGFFNYMREERQKQWVRGAFTRYLAPAIVDQLAKQPERLNLGGEMRPMTLLFSDVRGFTTISERFDAAGLTAFMNRYLTPMTEAILARGGTVDKYIGDAIMAFWNAPISDAAHARNACLAALDMLDRLAALNAELAAEAQAAAIEPLRISIGVGINTAVCCVGNMGSQQRFDYSVLGDGVNLASRIESQTKAYGVPILLGEDTVAAAPDLAVVEVDLIRVKGKTTPARIYTLLGDAQHAGTEDFKRLAAAQAEFLAAYRRCDWIAAVGAARKVRQAAAGRLDALLEIFLRRIEAFRAAPPPEGWDGVYTAETK